MITRNPMQQTPMPGRFMAHEHAWATVFVDSRDSEWPAVFCRICGRWRLDTPFGLLSCGPLAGFYHDGVQSRLPLP